jgi:hypothetical protein
VGLLLETGESHNLPRATRGIPARLYRPQNKIANRYFCKVVVHPIFWNFKPNKEFAPCPGHEIFGRIELWAE